MSEYSPDNWVVVKIMQPDQDTSYKVLAGWSGGYLDGDSWRFNSGITKVVCREEYVDFYGASGSVYQCPKGQYRLRMNNSGIWNQLKEKFGDIVELMPEDTDWSTIV
tara:strand:- start:461 stop:781 length:321 start_codon:yes stop_codon:yes gene_type:complete